MRDTKLLLICCMALVLLLPGASFPAGDVGPAPVDLSNLSLEELMEMKVVTVYGASKYEQDVGRAPSSVTVLTSDDIKKFGYRTLADILRSVRSFHISYDRNYNYIGIRGFSRPGDYNSRVLLLIDGHRINDNVYDTAPIGTEFPLDVDLIDRVEIIRGPGSSLYGSNAFFGVINVVTRRGADMDGAEVSGEAGSLRTLKGRISYGKTLQNGLDMTFSGSSYDSNGNNILYFREFDSPGTNNGLTSGTDHDRYADYFARLSYSDFSLEGAYGYRKKGIPTASFGTVFNDLRTYTVDERGYLELRYNHRFDRTLEARASLFYDSYYYYGHYAYPGFVNVDYGRGGWWGTELMLVKTLMERHKVIVGAEFRDNFKQNQGNYDVAVYLDDRRSSTNTGLYVQDEFTISENLILNAGVRYDHYSTFGSTTNPRIALIYEPFSGLTVKLLYGAAFRAPNSFELYYNDGGVTEKGNPGLSPEKIRTYELALEGRLGQRDRVSATIFYYRIDELISQDIDPSDGLIFYRNVDDVTAKGLELEFAHTWDNGARGRISYTAQQAKDDLSGSWLTNSPRHMAKANLVLPLIRERLFAGADMNWVGSRKTLGGGRTGSAYVADLTLFGQHFIKGVTASASIYNLFNKRYSDPGAAEHLQDAIRQDGRTYRVKLSYSF